MSVSDIFRHNISAHSNIWKTGLFRAEMPPFRSLYRSLNYGNMVKIVCLKYGIFRIILFLIIFWWCIATMAKKRKNQNKTHSTTSAIPSPDADLRKYAQAVFRERSSQFQRNGSAISTVYEGLDLDIIRSKRRIQAVAALADEVRARFSGICPDVPGCFSILEDWVGMNAYPYSAYDYVEKYVFSTFAASIWILDHIRDHGKLEQLNQILAGITVPPDVPMPDVWDPCHSRQMLARMVAVIVNRHQDQFPAKKNKQEPNSILRVYMDKATAERNINHTMPSRMLYDQVLSLIDPHALDTIKDSYFECYWEWLRRYFASRRIFVEEELLIRSQIDNFQKQLWSLADQIPALSNPGNKAPLLVQANPAVHSAPGFDTQAGHTIRRNNLEQQNRILFQMQEEYNTRFNSFTQEVGEFPLMPHDHLGNRYGNAIADCWSGFTVDDPYGMCMAFLLLLDEGSDLPWCYFPGVSIQTFYVSMLPWTRTKYCNSCDGIWEHYDSEIDAVVPGPGVAPLPKKIKRPDVDSWYQLSYRNTANKSSDSQTLYNLSHILYETTGCIMPRNPDRYQSALETWSRYGINSKKANLNLLYCMSLLGEGKHRSEMTHLATGQNSFDAGTLPDDVQSLQAELIRCREALQNAVTELSTEQRRHSELLERVSKREQEIQDLCHAVFHTSDRNSTLGVKFPYRTASQIVIFGTDKLWLKQMEAMLPDIVFLERWSRDAVDLIRKADMVWIQPEHMSHGDFRSIVTEVRKFDGTLRLFPNNNISECAAMLAKADIATC